MEIGKIFESTSNAVIDKLVDERNTLSDEVAELKRKLAEVEGERDALLALNAEMLAALNALLTRVERDEVQSIWMPDHACKQCVPGGDIVVPGFKCGLHAARAVRENRFALKITPPAAPL